MPGGCALWIRVCLEIGQLFEKHSRLSKSLFGKSFLNTVSKKKASTRRAVQAQLIGHKLLFSKISDRFTSRYEMDYNLWRDFLFVLELCVARLKP